MAKLHFNTVAIGVPAQRFDVRCHVSLERTIPVMTEFAIRLLNTVGAMTVDEMASYFGLSPFEVRELVAGLESENLVSVSGEELELSGYAKARFEASADHHPRFTAIAERRSFPTFELLTYRHVPRDLTGSDTTCALSIDVSGEAERTAERAERAFIDQFHDIERLVGSSEQKRAFGVYKVDDVIPLRRFNLPYPVRFELDEQGHVEYVFDEQLDVDSELRSKLEQLVSDAIGRRRNLGEESLPEFGALFSTRVIEKLSASGRFRLWRLVESGIAGDESVGTDDVTPLVGASYLASNASALATKLRDAVARFRASHKGRRIRPVAYWLSPGNELWGKTDLLGAAVEKIVDAGRPVLTDRFEIRLVRQKSPPEARRELSVVADAGIRNVIYCDAGRMNPRFEVLLLPHVFAAVYCHVTVPSTGGILMPVGIATSEPESLSRIGAAVLTVLRTARQALKRDGIDKPLTDLPLSANEFEFLSHAAESEPPAEAGGDPVG
jgi:hypothetical protein